MADIISVRVGQLPNEVFNLTDKIPHEIGSELYSGTVEQLADFISAYASTTIGVGFRAVSVADGQTLPTTDKQEFILVGKGTYPNVNGGQTLVLTEELNALISNGSFWTIGVEIPIDLELSGITQNIRSGYLETAPSENSVYNALSLKLDVANLPSHNELQGLNSGDFQHLTSTEKANLEFITNKKDTVTNSSTDYTSGKAVTDSLLLKEDKANKGVANGYAGLDDNNKFFLDNVPEALLGSVNYKGNYNASTNTPALPTPKTSNKGWYYTINGEGTYLGISYKNGDWIISNGVIWDKVLNNNNVTSVNGKVGAVVLSTADVADTTDKRYQTDAQKANNDATSSIQTQLNDKVSGSGVSGRVSFWNGAKSQTSDGGLFWDNTNKRLGVGTSTPSKSFELSYSGSTNGFVSKNTGGGYANIDIESNRGLLGSPIGGLRFKSTSDSFTSSEISALIGGGIQFWFSDGTFNPTKRTSFFNNGNASFGSDTDNLTDKLQVNGTISASPATLSNQVVVKSQLDAITVADATTTVKGKLKLAGDLGGTADLPTTPTALHKTGNETKTGQLKLQGNQGDTFNLLQISSGSTSGSAINIITQSNDNTIDILHQGIGDAISINDGNIIEKKYFHAKNFGQTKAYITNLGKIEGTSHVKSGAPTTNLLLAGGGDIAQSSFATSSTVNLKQNLPIKKSANFTAAINEYYVVTADNVNITLPATSTKGDGFMVLCIGDNVSIGGDDYYKTGELIYVYNFGGYWLSQPITFDPRDFAAVYDGVIQGDNINLNGVPTYTTDVLADADTALNSGEFYKLTGSRAIFQKP
jgi:hypothetical protein